MTGVTVKHIARALGAALFLSIVALPAALPALADTPLAGEAAPEFRLQDQDSEWHSLADYQGNWVALYFYPKADTPGCTTEACAFRDDIFAFRKLGVTVIGVSLDDVKSQKEFAEKYSLPFPLLSDRGKETAKSYGVFRKYGPIGIAVRETFLIDPEGRVGKHYDKVNPDKHSQQVLADLATLMQTAAEEAAQPDG